MKQSILFCCFLVLLAACSDSNKGANASQEASTVETPKDTIRPVQGVQSEPPIENKVVLKTKINEIPFDGILSYGGSGYYAKGNQEKNEKEASLVFYFREANNPSLSLIIELMPYNKETGLLDNNIVQAKLSGSLEGKPQTHVYHKNLPKSSMEFKLTKFEQKSEKEVLVSGNFKATLINPLSKINPKDSKSVEIELTSFENILVEIR